MLINFLSNIYAMYKYITTPRDYKIISEELEYKLDHNIKYQVEDPFWSRESRSWLDGILDEYYIDVTGKNYRYTTPPQNVMYTILRIKYYYGGKVYSVITNDLNFVPGVDDLNDEMSFSIPLTSVWLADENEKPVRNITDKVKRYMGPENDFHGEKVALEHFLYYDRNVLETIYPKMILKNSLGMKKVVSTLDDYTTDLRIP